ncbi:MAG: hypothetical protein WBP94_19645 [Rhodomicrobiaceae bacterium]
MVDIRAASMEEAVIQPKKSGFLKALGGPQFILAQLFTILATILGVYLAGYVGFQRTLEYDRLSKAEQQANLLEAMHAELQHNLTRLREFVPALEKTQEGEPVYREWPRLHLFIWQASAQNSALFDAPPQTLADMQAFYEDIGGMLNDTSIRDSFQHLTQSNASDRKYFTDRFDKLLKSAETTLLPALQNAAAASRQLISRYSGGAK